MHGRRAAGQRWAPVLVVALAVAFSAVSTQGPATAQKICNAAMHVPEPVHAVGRPFGAGGGGDVGATAGAERQNLTPVPVPLPPMCCCRLCQLLLPATRHRSMHGRRRRGGRRKSSQLFFAVQRGPPLHTPLWCDWWQLVVQLKNAPLHSPTNPPTLPWMQTPVGAGSSRTRAPKFQFVPLPIPR